MPASLVFILTRQPTHDWLLYSTSSQQANIYVLLCYYQLISKTSIQYCVWLLTRSNICVLISDPSLLTFCDSVFCFVYVFHIVQNVKNKIKDQLRHCFVLFVVFVEGPSEFLNHLKSKIFPNWFSTLNKIMHVKLRTSIQKRLLINRYAVSGFLSLLNFWLPRVHLRETTADFCLHFILSQNHSTHLTKYELK